MSDEDNDPPKEINGKEKRLPCSETYAGLILGRCGLRKNGGGGLPLENSYEKNGGYGITPSKTRHF